MPERCSYCHDGTERQNLTGEYELGSPRQKCPKCGRVYFDAGYEENALHAYKLQPKKSDIFHPLLFFVLIVLPIDVGAIYRMMQDGLNRILLISAVLFTVFGVGRIWVALYPRVFRKKILREYDEERMQILNTTKYISDEFSSSLMRMSDVKYLYYLISHGVEVPEYFFSRIGQTMDQELVEELRAARTASQKAHEERLEREAKMRELRNELEYCEECLSMDSGTSEFEMLAKMNGMSPRVFRMHCESRTKKLRLEIQDQLTETDTKESERGEEK